MKNEEISVLPSTLTLSLEMKPLMQGRKGEFPEKGHPRSIRLRICGICKMIVANVFSLEKYEPLNEPLLIKHNLKVNHPITFNRALWRQGGRNWP